MKKILYLFSVLIATNSFGQAPANDACVNAQAIALPSSGNICINSSNLNATSDNSTNACDVGAAGNEVWFTYVASGANNVITVAPNGVTPATGVVLTLITSGCNGGTYDVCNSATGTTSVSSTLGLAPGTVVLISVETNGTDGDFQLCISSQPPSSNPGDGCAQSSLVCDKSSIDFPNLTGFTASGTQPSCFAAAVRKDVWVKFTVGVTGTLEFTGTPLAGDEYDWAIYNITAGCLGTQVACNYNYASGGPFSCGTPGATFGMLASTAGQPCPAEFSAPITVTAGQTYAILIDNFSQSNNGFSLDWGGTFQMGTTALFSVTPQSSCTTPVTTTITNSSVGASTYAWNFGDGSTSTAANPGTHTYTTTGDYLMSLVVTGGGCTSVYSQRINLNTGPIIIMNPLTAQVCPPGSANLGATTSLGTAYNDRSFTNNPSVAIPNNTVTGITNTITSSGMINTTLTTGVLQSICFTINHTDHPDIGNGNAGGVTISVNGNTYSYTPLPLPAANGTRTYCFPQSVLNAIMAAGGNANTPWVLKVADTKGGGGGTGSLVSWNVVLRDMNSVTGYTWSPTATLTNTNTLNPTASPTTATVYSLTATDLFGCTTTKTATVSISCACPTLTSISYNGPYCQSLTSSATPSVTGAGAISSGAYSSTPAGLSLNATTGVITPSLSVANTYTVTYVVTAASCPTVSVNTVVVINATPTITVNNPTICSGTSTVLTAGTATSYLWSTGATTSTISVNPTSTTNFTVTGTTNGCAGTAVSQVSVNPTPTITVNSPTICSGTSTVLTAGTATSYSWSTGATTSTISVNPTSTTNFTVTGTT
ncbi:MAG: hypothetical protein K0S26_3019, partial [Bacteroidota bacterium]|nr:hypothetical protein [Bacteroidota bacterium]